MANRAGLKGDKNPMSKKSITNRYNRLKENQSISGSRVQIPPSPSYDLYCPLCQIEKKLGVEFGR